MAFNPANDLVAAATALNPSAPVDAFAGPVYMCSTAEDAAVETALRALFPGTAPVTDELWNVAKRRLLMSFAYNGSGPNVVATLAEKTIANENPGAPSPTVSVGAAASAIIATGTTVRRWCRRYAAYVWRYATVQNLGFPLGTKHGVPVAHRALGFDFVDGLNVMGNLSDDQRAVINVMRRVAIRDALGQAQRITNDLSRDHDSVFRF
jgi:hypothetical protein